MPEVTAIYGEKIRKVYIEAGETVGKAIQKSGLPLEQPCAGRGTCGLCKVLVEEGVSQPDEVEREHLSAGEIALNHRLACRARVERDARVVLTPIVVYSNKIFRGSLRYRRSQSPLGLAIDLGSTTVAAFLVTLDDGVVQAGAAGLNQQTVYGADVISRLAAAMAQPENASRLHRLAVASINHAVDALHLSAKVRQRIERVTIVSNVAMHHLLAEYPLATLAAMPFQPYEKNAIEDASSILEGIFSPEVKVTLPPMIGGFVGSDALACLAYFGFDKARSPIAAVDLGTNGEVMVTDGDRILTASTAAGPAFEGVNISCGSRAVDGAIIDMKFRNGEIELKTIADQAPVGLTGTGLISAVNALREEAVIEESGRISESPPFFAGKITRDTHGGRRLPLSVDGSIGISQWDIRELQKAKGAIRAAIDTLMEKLNLKPKDIERFILTGSFGGQVDLDAVVNLGMIPPIPKERIHAIANGAGFGAAMFLSDEGFAHAIRLAERSEQIDLDHNPEFNQRYVNSLYLSPGGRKLDDISKA